MARQLSSKPKPYNAGGDGGQGLSQVCLERLAYVPTLPEVLRGEPPMAWLEPRLCWLAAPMHRCHSSSCCTATLHDASPHPCPSAAGKHEMVEGDSRECVGGHEVICSLFPRLSSPHGGHAPMRIVKLKPASVEGEEAGEQRPLRLGVVLSGGQAPGARAGGWGAVPAHMHQHPCAPKP